MEWIEVGARFLALGVPSAFVGIFVVLGVINVLFPVETIETR
jgi:hypothetical protein